MKYKEKKPTDVVTDVKKVENAKVASQPHLAKLQENSKLFAAKTQEAAKNAAEVINETVQVTRERANSALSKEFIKPCFFNGSGKPETSGNEEQGLPFDRFSCFIWPNATCRDHSGGCNKCCCNHRNKF